MSAAQTPVDMSPYTDQNRARAEMAAQAATSVSRLSLARRPTIELPTANTLPLAAGLSASALVAREGVADDTAEEGPRIDGSSSFDVPAFLRRQES
jgi:hypothetical protein